MVDALSGISAVGAVSASPSLGAPRSALTAQALLGTELTNNALNPEVSSLELSTTAQLIETILAVSDLPSSDQTPTQALTPAPAISGQPSTPELAEALSHAVTYSGLFYESHLADWLSGLKSKADVLQEPQAKLNNEVHSPSKASELLANSLPLESGHSSLANLSNTLHPQTLSLVQQQLQSIDTQAIPWNGQIWPNQQLEWTVQPETYPDDQNAPSNPSPIRWKSTLKLTLPHLGEVQALLSLGPQGVQIHLSSDAAQVQGIQSALPLLGQRLQDAGIRPEQLVVAASTDANTVVGENPDKSQHD